MSREAKTLKAAAVTLCVSTALLVLGPRACRAQTSQMPTIVVHPATLREWALLYREFSTEFLQCVYGEYIADTLFIVMALPADVRPALSTVNTVDRVSDCPDGPRLGDAHSHPRSRQSLIGQRFQIPPDADLCYLSPQDRRSFGESDYFLEIVVCGPTQAAVFFRNGKAMRCVFDAEVPHPACKWTQLPDFLMAEP